MHTKIKQTILKSDKWKIIQALYKHWGIKTEQEDENE